MVKLTESIVYIRTKMNPDGVKKLNLWGCEIDNIELCEKMRNIEVLSLSVNQVRTLQPLRNCKKLRELYLRKNEIESLKELEHLRDLKELRVLWIDENPCTIANDYRHKVVGMLPQLTMLDDLAVSAEDRSSPERGHDSRVRKKTSHYVHNTAIISQSQPPPAPNGFAIVDTIMPSQMILDYGSSDTEEEEPRSHRSMANSIHTLPSSMVNSFSSNAGIRPNAIMSQSCYQIEEKDDDTWADFSIEEDTSEPAFRPTAMDPRMVQSFYESGSQTLRSSPFGMRSASVPRPRRGFRRNESQSPARERRLEKIMSAVSVLLDELDQDGLRTIIDEAQRRIKKQR